MRLIAASLVMDTVGHGFPLLLVLQAQSVFQASAGAVGWLGTLFPLVYSIVCLTTGGLSDRVGSAPLLAVSFVLLTVAIAGAGFSASLAGLCLSQAIFGLALAFFWPPVQREVSLLSPGALLWPTLGLFNLAWALGSVIGTLGASQGHAGLGFRAMMACSLGLVAATAGITAGPEQKKPPAEELRGDEAPPPTGTLFLRLAWVSNFAASFGLAGVHFLGVYVASRLAWGPGWMGAILAAKEVGRFLAFIWLGRHAGWHYSLAWLSAAQLVAGTALLACSGARAPVAYAAAFFILGVFSGISYYSSLYYGLNLRSGEGRKSALHEGILAVGACLGPVSMGMAGDACPAWPGVVVFVPGAVILACLALELTLAGRAAARAAGARNPAVGG